MCLAIPGKIVSITSAGNSRLCVVEFGGAEKTVYLNFVPDAQPNDYVLVHAGFAIARVDAVVAEETLALLREAGAAPSADPESGRGGPS